MNERERKRVVKKKYAVGGPLLNSPLLQDRKKPISQKARHAISKLAEITPALQVKRNLELRIDQIRFAEKLGISHQAKPFSNYREVNSSGISRVVHAPLRFNLSLS